MNIRGFKDNGKIFKYDYTALVNTPSAKAEALIQTVEGESIAVANSAEDALQGLSIYGKSEQFSTTGKNLLPNTATTKTTNGVTFTVNDDGSITVDGTATATADLYVAGSWASSNTILAASEDTYVVSGSGDAGMRVCAINNETVVMDIEPDTSSVQTTFPEGITAFMIRVETGNTFSNLTYYPMIRLASVEDDTYEPYTGGIPSPNPSYPQEIASLGDDGEIEVGVYGKNLFKCSSYTLRGASSVVNDDGSITVSGTSIYNWWNGGGDNIETMASIPAGTYVYSITEPIEFVLGIKFYDLDGINTNFRIYSGKTSVIFDITKELRLAYFYLERIPTGEEFSVTFKPMLRLASIKDDTYEPYKAKQTFTISTPNGLPGIPVTDSTLATYTDSDGQMWCADEVDLERGVYVQRIVSLGVGDFKRVVVSEDGNWADTDISYTYELKVPLVELRSGGAWCGQCSHFESYSFSGFYLKGIENGCMNNMDYTVVNISKTLGICSTVDEFKQWCIENDVRFIKLLATPIETSLSPEEITAYKALHSNYPNTTVLNDESMHMEVEYIVDTQIYLDEMKAASVQKTDISSEIVDDETKVPSSALLFDVVKNHQEDIYEVSRVKGDAIVQSAEGEAIAVSDASDDGFRGLNVFGKSGQFTTTGKNLLGLLPDNLVTTNGLTGTINADGSITVNGTPNHAYAGCYGATMLLEPGTYFISGGVTTDKMYAQVAIIDSEGNAEYYVNKSFAIDETESSVTIMIQAGNYTDTISNYTVYPMLNAGETALPWEPYTGGIPSPNPDYPQEITSVGDDGEIEVGVYGKNLLPYPYVKSTLTNNGITFTDNGDGSITVNGTSTAYTSFLLWSGKEQFEGCYISTGADDSTAETCYVRGVAEDGTYYRVHSTPVKLEKGIVALRIAIPNADITLNNMVLRPMISIASTEYEPYKAKQTLTISTPNGLPGILVTDSTLATYTDSDGQMWCADEVDFERGVYVQRIGEVKPDEWVANNVLSGTSGHRFKAEIPILKKRSCPCLCTHYMHAEITSYGSEGDYISTDEAGRINIRTLKRDFSTIKEFRAFIEEENMKVYYLLATPIETALSDEEIAQYKALHTNYPNTTILNDEGAWMGAKYNTDTKTYIDNKFAELTNAIISLGGNV